MKGENQKEKNIPIEETKEENDKPLYWTKKEPRKALSTYFRNQNKVLVSYMAIADRKAMIMIKVNSFIVSASILFYRYLNDNLPHGWLICIILIIGAGAALVFAVLAAKPNGHWLQKFFDKNIKPTYKDLEYNNFYPFGEFTLAEYERSMDEVVRSQELQIGNQTRFAYIMETYLRNKYRLLDLAYNMFLGTFIVVAIIFMVGVMF